MSRPFAPSHINGVLDALHRHGYPEAMVGGGCLRDWDNLIHPQVKDIDLFVQGRGDDLELIRGILPEFSGKLFVSRKVADYWHFENVIEVLEFRSRANPEFPPVQIIVMDELACPRAVIARNDFGLCQIGYSGREVIRTDAYLRDKANRTFTVCRCRDERDFFRTMRRWERLHAEKFHDWTLVVPAEFQHHYCAWVRQGPLA